MNESTIAASTNTPTLQEGWLRRFLNRSQPYALQQADGAYRWVYEPCTTAIFAAHLTGDLTLALSSTDARGAAKWICLDVDAPGALPQLLALRDALVDLDLPGLVESSRRGGHLWLFFDEPVPAVSARYLLSQALAQVSAEGVEVPTHELYPDTGVANTLGHAVRLPLGIHCKTGRRYPLLDDEGLPCVFTMPEKALAHILAMPQVSAHLVRDRWQAFIAGGGTRGAHGVAENHAVRLPSSRRAVGDMPTNRGVGTRSAVIRWVDSRLSPIELLATFFPENDLRRVGKGYLGWCPFHDDRAPDSAGQPGSPSFYIVQDRRFGWSWRCLSTNCAQSIGPMRHSFRLFQELLGLTPSAAIVAACERWPEASTDHQAAVDEHDRRNIP